MAATLRLPDDLEQTLAEHCARTGAAKNRVIVLALRAYLGAETLAEPEAVGDGRADTARVQPIVARRAAPGSASVSRKREAKTDWKGGKP